MSYRTVPAEYAPVEYGRPRFAPLREGRSIPRYEYDSYGHDAAYSPYSAREVAPHVRTVPSSLFRDDLPPSRRIYNEMPRSYDPRMMHGERTYVREYAYPEHRGYPERSGYQPRPQERPVQRVVQSTRQSTERQGQRAEPVARQTNRKKWDDPIEPKAYDDPTDLPKERGQKGDVIRSRGWTDFLPGGDDDGEAAEEPEPSGPRLLSDRQVDIISEKVNKSVDIWMLGEGQEGTIIRLAVSRINNILLESLNAVMPPHWAEFIRALMEDGVDPEEKRRQLSGILQQTLNQPLASSMNRSLNIPVINEEMEQSIFRKVVEELFDEASLRAAEGLQASGFA